MRNFVNLTAVLALCCPLSAWSSEAPIFQSQTLTVPRVDTSSQVGKYQDGVLQQKASGEWILTSVQALGEGTLYNVLGVGSVEVIKTTSHPVMVYLRVSGHDLPCDHTGPERIHQRMVGSRFDVNISSQHLFPNTGVYYCPHIYRPYKITIPLNVYGLSAGTYTYQVNGASTGSFTLESANKFADDCPAANVGGCLK